MRIVQIFFILGFSLVAFASYSTSGNETDLTILQDHPDTACFSSVPEGLVVHCSICHSGLGPNDIYRYTCQHGYHGICLLESFTKNLGNDQHKTCQNCSGNNDYFKLLLFFIFTAPEINDEITYTPGLIDVNMIISIWANAMQSPDTIALERAFKIGLPTKDLNCEGTSFQMIELASVSGTPENLNFLIDRGEIFSPKDSSAIQEGFGFAITKSIFANSSIFLSRGANINYFYGRQCRTLLHSAIHNGDIKAVEFLIENGADVNLAASGDFSPFLSAVLSDNGEIVELMMKTSFSKLTIADSSKNSPIHSAIRLGNLNALTAIFDNGFSKKNYSFEGLSWVQCACVSGSLDTVKFLTDRGFEFISKKGVISYLLHTTICVCSPSNDATIAKIKFLLEYGANPYESMNSSTLSLIISQFPFYASHFTLSDPAIVIAILKNNFDIFKVFLDYGINPNTRIFNESRSLLHLVCELGKVPMAAYLISIGADIHSLDSKGKKPFDLNTKEFANQVFNF